MEAEFRSRSRMKHLNLCIVMVLLNCCGRFVRSQMTAFRVEDPKSVISVSGEGVVHVQSGQDTVLRVFSSMGPFHPDSQVSFTNKPEENGANCEDLRMTEIKDVSVNGNSGVVSVRLHPTSNGESLMFCLREKTGLNGTWSPWVHQGNSSWLQLVALPNPNSSEVPVWVKCVLVVIFAIISAICSGLRLVLLNLTKNELKVLRNNGSSKERRHVKSVMPLRKRGNYLLCALLFVNTLANVAVTVILFQLIGLYALIAATFGVVLLCEILPRTVCSCFGLVVGAKTVWLTNFFLIITFPISYPLSKLMDLVLQNEIPMASNRDRLLELVKSVNTETETKHGKTATTVDLSTKCVKDIMTKLEDVYMAEYNSILTSDMLSQILKTGYTRVPVYETDRTNIVALLHVRDLALLDPDTATSLKTLCKFFNHPVNFVFEDTKLNVMLEEFKKGQSHMAFIQRVNCEGSGDPFYETLGMVTLEDVIEDIFQSEISDESAVVLDNKELMGSLRKMSINSFPIVHYEKNNRIASNTLQAARNFLSSSVAQFHPQWISEKVLQHLIEQSSVLNLQMSDPAADRCIYEKGKASDRFVLILNGTAQIDIGNEHFTFTEGPFSYFGSKVLSDSIDSLTNSVNLGTISEKITLQQSHYVPDFALRAVTDVQYLVITRTMYVAALRASLLQRQQYLIGDNSDAHLPDYDSLIIDDRTSSFANIGPVDMRSLDLDISSRTKLLAKSMDV